VKFSVQLPTDRVERGDEYTSIAAITEMAAAIEGAGVTWVSLGVPGESRAEYLESIARFGAEVIA
jgi:hypothetical protein